MKAAALSLTLLGALLGAASAQPRLSAQSIIVNPAPSPLGVRVWTDRDASGTQTPGYAPGERIRLYASVAQDAYVYLFNVDPGGQVDLILPNRYAGGANFLKAGAVKVFPSPGDGFTFDIAAPYGVNKVLALASARPLNLDDIATFKKEQNTFATVNVQGQERLAQALSIVVSPAPTNSWQTSTAYYRVVQAGTAAAPTPAPTPRSGAPLTAQPLGVTVAPASPWGNAREWQTVVEGRPDLRALHDDYAARLRAEGYVLTRTKTKNSEIESTFRKGGKEAKLTLKRKGNRVEIKVERE